MNIHIEKLNIMVLFFGSSLWLKEKKDHLNRQIIDWKSLELNEWAAIGFALFFL